MIMKGYIIVNPFGIPGQNLHQAKRLQQEFALKDVQAEILTDAFLRARVEKGNLYTTLNDGDFIIYLDKDKYLSGILNGLGIKTFNSHNSIRVCDDKGETYIALANKGFSLPKTQFAPMCYSNKCQIDNGFVNSLEQNIGYPMVVKTSYGSCGTGIYKVNNKQELLPVMENLKTSPHMYQEYLGKEVGKDIRVIVIGGKAVAGMIRSNEKDFRSNIALGGKGEKIDLDSPKYSQVKTVCQDVAKTLGLDYCGVDILKGNNDEPVICEVNSNAFFEGIESVTKINVAKTYAEYVINSVLGSND